MNEKSHRPINDAFLDNLHKLYTEALEAIDKNKSVSHENSSRKRARSEDIKSMVNSLNSELIDVMKFTSIITRSQRKDLSKTKRYSVTKEVYIKRKNGTFMRKPGPKPKHGPKSKPVEETNKPAKQPVSLVKTEMAPKQPPLLQKQVTTTSKPTITAKQSATVLKNNDSVTSIKSPTMPSLKPSVPYTPPKKLLKCFHCNIEFKSKEKFYEHLKNHEKKGYTCQNCKKYFTNKLEWNCHTNIFCKQIVPGK